MLRLNGVSWLSDGNMACSSSAISLFGRYGVDVGWALDDAMIASSTASTDVNVVSVFMVRSEGRA